MVSGNLSTLGVLTVVQARMGSRRLPGKVLERIGARTVLEHVIARVREADLGAVVIATSSRIWDVPIVLAAADMDVPCYGGSEDDVLLRFVTAWQMLGADATVIARVTADCPFLDPGLLRAVVDKVGEDYDYAGVKGAPDGLHQEAFTVDAMLRADRYATSPEDREHVVPYILRNRRCGWVHVDMTGDPCTLDTIDDLERLRERVLV